MRGRKPKHPDDKRKAKTYTFDQAVVRQFSEWCHPSPVSRVLEHLMVRAMDMDSDPLSLFHQIQETEKTVSEQKYKVSKSQVELESQEHKLAALRDRYNQLINEQAMEDVVQKKHDERMQYIRKKYIPIFHNYPTLHRDAGLSVELVKKRTSLFDGKSHGECTEIMDIVFPGWR